MRYYTTTFASTYGSCNYGGDQYDNSAACTSGTTGGGTTTGSSAGGSSSGSSAGGLANTGFDIILAATVACVIVFSALVIRFVRRPAKSTPSGPNSKA